MTQGGYTQAGIAVQNAEAFEHLRAAIERALADEIFFKQLKRRGLRIREFEAILRQGVVMLAKSGPEVAGDTAWALYGALPVADQAQMREFYLTRIEQLGPEVRRKYHKQFETY